MPCPYPGVMICAVGGRLRELSRQKRTRYILILAILISIPCYCIGFAILKVKQSQPEEITPTITLTATRTPTITRTPYITLTPSVTATITQTYTASPTRTSTATRTFTPSPTNTSPPTETPIPIETETQPPPLPTDTEALIPTGTDTP